MSPSYWCKSSLLEESDKWYVFFGGKYPLLRRTCELSCHLYLYFYLHVFFLSILHSTIFFIYIILYFGPNYNAQNFITILYNFYKTKKKISRISSLMPPSSSIFDAYVTSFICGWWLKWFWYKKVQFLV